MPGLDDVYLVRVDNVELKLLARSAFDALNQARSRLARTGQAQLINSATSLSASLIIALSQVPDKEPGA